MTITGENGCPAWLRQVVPRLIRNPTPWFRMFDPPDDPGRRSAVLLLFGRSGDGDLDLVLTERAHTLSSHAAQVVFPGGHLEPGDDGPRGAALRETTEEVGLRPETVEVLGVLPSLYLHPSRNAVTPVLGWWREPHELRVVDEAEVATVVRARVRDLVDPANRFSVRGPAGYKGPGFEAEGLYVWGFTATLLSEVLELGGVDRPWNEDRERALPWRLMAPYVGLA